MSDDTIGALWVAAWGAIDAACTFTLAADSQYGAAALVGGLGILTLTAFARAAIREVKHA